MAAGIFYRNIRARDQLELFLLAAVSSLLLVRLYLHLTGYPQIGSGGLHIAHMLWGGVLMLAALSMVLSFLGTKSLRLAAIIGGVGFGIFIDELGKFITRDNNYFYQPAIGIIYAIFVALYLLFNFLSRSQPLTNREYQLNALAQLEEAIVQDMNPSEKEKVANLLALADQKDPLTRMLQNFLKDVQTIQPRRPHRVTQLLQRIDTFYVQFWHWRNSGLLIRGFILIEVLLFVGGVTWSIYGNINSVLDLLSGNLPYSLELAIGQLVSASIAAGFAIWGAIVLPRSRQRAYEQFRRATLINIFLTQFFAFARMEFAALPGFFFNLALLGLIAYAIHQERRVAASKKAIRQKIAR